MPMTPATLRDIGEALWGLSWQSAMARKLGVSSRTVRRWAAGEWPAPPWAETSLRVQLDTRLKTLRGLREALAAV